MSITQNNDNVGGKSHISSFYITTPIYYVNDRPHIGHAYTSIVADCIGRLKALNGFQVRMQTGSDEHGQKVLKSALDRGENPMQFCNQVSEHFYKLGVDVNCFASYPDFNSGAHFNMHRLTCELYNNRLQRLSAMGAEIPAGGNTKEDVVVLQTPATNQTFESQSLYANGENFIRTTEGRDVNDGSITPSSLQSGRHVKAVLHFWKKLVDNGWIYKGNYSGWYAVRDEAFYAESELIEGKAPTGAEVVWKSEEAYFFRLSKFQRILLEIHRQHNIIEPYERRSEIISFLSGIDLESGLRGEMKEGYLQDLCVSRINMEWGIPVPDDPKHTIYVWIDALVNYISALHYPAQYAINYWNNSQTVNIVGKDIIRFHSVYWPAILIAEDSTVDEFDAGYFVGEPSAKGLLDKHLERIPKGIFAHGWWTNKGEKISKSLGNVIDPELELKAIAENFGIDKLFASDYFRFSLLYAMPLGNDGNYNRDVAWSSIDSILCGGIGNLINRTFSMIRKHLDPSSFFKEVDGDFLAADIAFLTNTHLNLNNGIKNLFLEYASLVDGYKLQEILKVASKMADRCNSYIESSAPWSLAKADVARLKSVLQLLYVQIVLIMQILRFAMPNFVERFFDHIGLDYNFRRVPTVDNGGVDAEFRNVGDGDSGHIEVLGSLLKLYKPQSDETLATYLVDLPIFFPKSITER